MAGSKATTAATTRGALDVGAGITEAEDVLVGKTFGPRSVEGTLSVSGGGVTGNGAGFIQIGAAGPNTTNGTTATGSATVNGDIGGFTALRVGFVDDGGGDATGSLEIDGALNLGSNTLVAGLSTGAGDADGTLRVTGDATFGNLDVGVVEGDQGHAKGLAAFTNGNVAANEVAVGSSFGAGTTDARMELDGVLLSSNFFFLENGGEVAFTLQPGERGSDYAAVDAAAILFGQSTVELNFTGATIMGQEFELFRTTIQGQSLVGDTPDRVVNGLPEELSVILEKATLDPAFGESLRATVVAVPEPAAFGLVLCGTLLCVIPAIRRR